MPKPSSERLISSRDNPIVRHLQSVARRREPGLVLLEGPRVVQQADAAGVKIDLLAIREGEACSVRADQVVRLTPPVFTAVTQTQTPQGVVAVAEAWYRSLDEVRARASDAGWPLLVLDGIQDPGNVGTILRSAAAFGAPAVVLLPGTADALAPKAVRASAGTVFRLAIARCEPAELQGLRGLGAAADAEQSIYDADLRGAGMIVLGSEAHGLRLPGLQKVRIPMVPDVESLNVAAAAAIMLHEMARQVRR